MKALVLVIIGSILITACKKGDGDGPDSALEGRWTLTNALCYCGFGDNPDFSGHKLIFAGNNLKIENFGEFKFLTNAEGTYTRNDNMITLKNGKQYTYVIMGSTLELTFVDELGIADDELFLEYERG